ncbi:MAG: hypothetical protein DME32_15070 [Verrucomicrobia bacterium]|nr:MAG: hypothetical protein DME32_15070 [Verrucomicrobiota bacterium]
MNAGMGIQRTSHSAAGGAPVDSNAPDIELQGEKKSTGRVASAKKKKLNSEAWGPLKGSLCESRSLGELILAEVVKKSLTSCSPHPE